MELNDREPYHARNCARDRIREGGAMFNLAEGIEAEIHGIRTRLAIWPGVGQTESAVRLLTVRPGDESESCRLGMSEEAMVCLSGKGGEFSRPPFE